MTEFRRDEIAGEFAGADLGDPRRNARLLQLAEGAARKPDTSFPKMFSSAELEAAYRFFGNVKVRPAEILEPHFRQTLLRMAAEELTLVAHDTSTLSFNSEGHREGLTSIRGDRQQFLIHCSLALRSDGSRLPLGMLAVSHHVHVKTTGGLLQDRWGAHVRSVHALGAKPENVVHLMDREADDFEVLDQLMSIGGRFVIRVHHNRKLRDQFLWDAIAEAPMLIEREVALSRRRAAGYGPKRRKTHPPRNARIAQLAISSREITIPRSEYAAQHCAKSWSLSVVRVWEPDPPEGQSAVEWVLYSSEPVETSDQVIRIVDWYRARWTIEEYFKALKTGCAIEKRQLGDLHALSNATALLVPIAWRLLLLKTEARQDPEAPAALVLDEDELEVLRIAGRRPLPKNPTVLDAMLSVAALGGHLKHNGPPGWQTLAHGYQALRQLTAGWSLRRAVETGNIPPASDQ